MENRQLIVIEEAPCPELTSLIRPLPDGVTPAPDFVERLRARILAASDTQKDAA